MTNRLSESFIKAFGKKVSRTSQPIHEKSQVEILEAKISETSAKINSARIGGVGNIGKLTEQKLRLERELEEAKGSRKNDSPVGDVKPGDVEDDVETPKHDGSKTQAPKRRADATVNESVKFNGRTFKDYKTFNSEKEANDFLEKNEDYGVIGEKDGKVYVAKMEDMGEERSTKTDPVDKREIRKSFDKRSDKDIDNDGDVDSADEYLHKRRKAITKAMKKKKTQNEEVDLEESYAIYHKGSVFDTFNSKEEAKDAMDGMDLSASEKKDYKIRKVSDKSKSDMTGKMMKEEKTIKVSFNDGAAKKKWMKKQSVSPKEVINQTSASVELPASMKQYAKAEDHDEIYQVKE